MKKIIILLTFSLFISCEDEKNDSVNIDEAYVGIWIEEYSADNTNADCSGNWVPDTSFIKKDYGIELKSDGTAIPYNTEMGIASVWSSNGATGLYMNAIPLTFIETDGEWVMWMEMQASDMDNNPLYCYRVGYTKQ